MPNGTVKFFNAGKGFGFITPDDAGKDIFVPSASVTSAGIGTLKPGQRVSFEIKPDARGPMAVGLGLLAEPPRPLPPKEAPQNRKAEERHRLTFYFDPADDNAQSALEDLRAAGHDPRLVDYVATPLKREELRTLSAMLSNKNQNLVKTYAALFYDLRLNDRFLSQNEYWDAIVEHPSLINGPIVSTSFDANLYSAKSGVDAFLSANFPNAVPVSRGPKAAELPKEDPISEAEEDAAVENDDVSASQDAPRAAKKTKAPAASKAKTAVTKPKATAKRAVAKPAAKAKAKASAKK
jgi:CspA family cold shock protein